MPQLLHHDYEVKIFAPVNQGGHLLLHTWNKTEHSKDMEVAAALERRKRGEVGSIHVVSFVEPVGTTHI